MKAIMRKAACILVTMAVMIGIISPEVEAVSVKYKTYSNKRFVYSVKYPSVFNKSDYGSGDGTKLISADKKAQGSIWNSYGSKKRTGKSVAATAKKGRKIKLVKATAKECNYYYNSGKNIVQYYYYFLSNGEVSFQITYPKSQKSYYSAAVNGMIKSIKANKKLTLKD